MPDYIPKGSATNPISADDSDSSVSSPVQDIDNSSNPVEDTQGSASNSENEEEAKKSQNSSSNDGNRKGGGGGLNTSDKDISNPIYINIVQCRNLKSYTVK